MKYIKEKWDYYFIGRNKIVYTFKELLKEYKDKRKPKKVSVYKIEWITGKTKNYE